MGSIAKIKTMNDQTYDINPIQTVEYAGSSDEYTISIMKPNTYYRVTNVKKLTISAFGSGDSGFCNNYMLEVKFNGGSTLSLPSNANRKWANGIQPTSLEDGGVYQISIINDLGVLIKLN